MLNNTFVFLNIKETELRDKDVCSLEITIFCCTSIEIVSLIFVLCFSRNGHNFSIRSSKLFFEILKLSTRSDSRNSPFTNFSHYPDILPLLTWLGDTVSFSVLATDVSFYERRMYGVLTFPYFLLTDSFTFAKSLVIEMHSTGKLKLTI